MRRRGVLTRIVLFSLAASSPARADWFAFVPETPVASDAVTVTLTEPFDCTAPQPTIDRGTPGTIAFTSLFPSGVVHCGMIPFPPPATTSFQMPLGRLGAGTYAVVWDFYRDRSPDPPAFISRVTTTLVVGAVVAPRPQAEAAPTLSLSGAIACGGICVLLGLLDLARRRRWPA